MQGPYTYIYTYTEITVYRQYPILYGWSLKPAAGVNTGGLFPGGSPSLSISDLSLMFQTCRVLVLEFVPFAYPTTR
jgi:hypothetical protein